MYLSRANLIYTRLIAALQLVLGGPCTALFAIVIIGGLAGDADVRRDIPQYIAGLISFGCVTALGISNLVQIGRAKRFNSLFQGQPSGRISIKQNSQLFRIQPHRFARQFDSLIRRGLLVNCHIDYVGEPVIVLHSRKGEGEYIVRPKTILSHIIAFVMIGIGGFLMVLMIFGFLLDLLEGNLDFGESRHAGFVAISSFAGAMLLGGLWMRAQIGEAYRFNSLFTGDDDGLLSVKRTAAILGLRAETLASRFDRLVRHGYLCRCRLMASEGEPQIYLHNGAAGVHERFVAVICPGCGASNSFQAGFIGKCRYCGRNIKV